MVEDDDDAEVIRQCLWAAVNGPFFPEWEFHTLFGFDRDEIRQIAQAWPHSDDDELQSNAVDSTLNNLISYPHGRWEVWHDYISPTAAEVRRVYERFRGERLDQSAKGYFDRLS